MILRLLIIIFLLPTPAFALTPIVIDDGVEKTAIGRNMEYIADKDGKISISDVRGESLNWNKSEQDSFGFGFTSAYYWFRFTVKNDSEKQKDWYLELSNPMLDYIELYIPEKNGKFREIITGDHYPFKQRDVIDTNFVFHLEEISGETTYYLRVFSPESSLGFLPTILSQKSYLQKFHRQMPIFWMYYGLMFVMVFYNLFIFFSVRDISYLYLVLFIIIWILLQFSIGGHSYRYLWSDSPWWGNQCIAFFISGSQIFCILFPRSYINTRKHFPVFDRILLFSGLIPCGILALLSLFMPYRVMIRIVDGYAIYVVSMLLFLSIYATMKGSRQARFVLTAFIVMFIGALIHLLKTFGVLPSTFFTEWSMQIGSSLLVVLFSLGLADNINTMKNDLAFLNKNLETMVRHRTEQLQKAMDALWGEMELAKKIQTCLLPKKPEISGYEIAASCEPADEVGGDYYDVISVGGFDWIVIGDVSGHGITAGLVMMMVQTAIHTVLIQNPEVPTSRLLSVINRTIYENIVRMDEQKHMTILVIACGRDGFFDFSGLHEDILFWCADTEKVEKIATDGMWIGLEPDISKMLPMNEFRMETDDCIVLYTDGIIEARNREDGSFFGEERLEKIISSCGGGSAAAIHAVIMESLKEYEKPDDITLFVMKRV